MNDAVNDEPEQRPNHAERRAAKARSRLLRRRINRVAVLDFTLARLAHEGKISRNAARRRLRAEVIRRYGAPTAKTLNPKLAKASLFTDPTPTA